jgi:hypothetical protein
MSNTTMDKLAVGAVFQFGHNRDGRGLKWVKDSNRYARCFQAACQIPNANAPASDSDEQVAAIEVTCLGNEASYQRVD